jgi:NADH-quinone oxidoreductase subunit J
VALPPTVPYFNIPWDDLLFLLFGGLMLAAALGVVLGRNIIRSGLAMILSFASLAGIYVLLGAPLVAAAQVLIYIGAISVLILFAIMLTQSKSGPAALVFHHQAWAAAVAAIVLGVLLVAMVAGAQWPAAEAARIQATTKDIAKLVFSDYLLPFEVVSILLLAAVIGGVFLAKRDDAEVSDSAAARPAALGPAPVSGTARGVTPELGATISAATITPGTSGGTSRGPAPAGDTLRREP